MNGFSFYNIPINIVWRSYRQKVILEAWEPSCKTRPQLMICFLIAEERRLAHEEKPLLVQLNWNKDDREGRFLLRRMDLNGRNRVSELAIYKKK